MMKKKRYKRERKIKKGLPFFFLFVVWTKQEGRNVAAVGRVNATKEATSSRYSTVPFIICAQLYTGASTGVSNAGTCPIDCGILSLSDLESKETEPWSNTILRVVMFISIV